MKIDFEWLNAHLEVIWNMTKAIITILKSFLDMPNFFSFLYYFHKKQDYFIEKLKLQKGIEEETLQKKILGKRITRN